MIYLLHFVANRPDQKYTSMSFVGEIMFGYNHAIDQATITPIGGFRYNRVNDGGYAETGSTTGQNLQVSSKASNTN